MAFVATAILFFTFTSQIFVIWPYLESVNTSSVLILVTLNFFVTMALINYYLTCKTDPGSVPPRWVIIDIAQPNSFTNDYL